MGFWNGKKVLITGHTGFKGSWLSLWLEKLGSEVIGYALQPPTNPNLFHIAEVEKNILSIIGDIRNKEFLLSTIREYQPEIVFHLAAQPIVRQSYNNPVETFETNVLGTVNLFDSVRLSDSVKVVINVTSDKCYENKEWLWGYRETDSMGGHDPYSCSKGCSELITNSFRESYFRRKNIYLSSVRAGNVIGGGDWAKDRLIPDIIKTSISQEFLNIRNPLAIRPWQHVLEPLNGYLMLAEAMWNGEGKYSDAWNFGPNEENIINVSELTDKIKKIWNKELRIKYGNSNEPHEAQLLKLDSSKARTKLGWYPKLNIEQTLLWTVDWYEKFISKKYNMRDITLQQIKKYERIGE